MKKKARNDVKNKKCICVVCGAEFLSCRSTGKYCSVECRRAGERQRKAASKGKTAWIPKEVKCPRCGKMFLKLRRDIKYCTPECRINQTNLRTSEQRRAERNAKYNPRQAKKNRAKSQININKTNAKAKALGLTYGEYQGRKLVAGSVLDEAWAQELIRKNNKECETSEINFEMREKRCQI